MQIGIGIIGCGYWGKNYVRIFQELPQTKVVQVSDLQEESLGVVQKYYPSVKITRDYRDILKDSEIDAVVVATPANSHYEITKESLLAGKHVLVEKPLSSTLEEGEKLIELGYRQQRTLMVGHTFLYNAGIRKVRECIESNSPGRIYYLHATRTNLGPIRSDVNALWDLAPHDISIFNYLLDAMPETASATGASFLGNGREDVVFVTLNYPGGIVGHIHVSWVDPNKVRQITLVGSQQRIVFDDLSTIDRVRIFDKGVVAEAQKVDSYGEFRLRVHDGDITSPKIEASEPLKNMCQHFIECLQTGSTPFTDGLNGLDVLRVMVAVTESIKRNNSSVSLQACWDVSQIPARIGLFETTSRNNGFQTVRK